MTADVVVVCPFYYCFDPQRADITRRVFHHYSQGDFIYLGVGAEGDVSRDLFCEFFPEEQYREWTADIPEPGSSGNPELHEKAMYALAEARAYDPKAVYIIGSDDFVPLDFIRPFDGGLRGFNNHADGGVHMWHYGTDEYAWIPGDYGTWPDIRLAGAILGHSREVLDHFDWYWKWDHGEIGVEREVRAAGFEIVAEPGTFWIAKCDHALNPWHLWKPNMQFVAEEKIEAFRQLWGALDDD